MTAIQLIGSFLAKYLGARVGAILSGFISGLISSTAFTATLAKKSKNLNSKEIQIEAASFLSATLAMLVQALFLVVLGLNTVPVSILYIFFVPISVTLFLIFVRYKKTEFIEVKIQETTYLKSLYSILKLSVFIIFIISVSNVLQIYYGSRGLELLTFLVSLFEIHGSVIANTQLLLKNIIIESEFKMLLCLSILASYISKVVMICVLGSTFLKKRVLIWSGIVLTSLLITFWIV